MYEVPVYEPKIIVRTPTQVRIFENLAAYIASPVKRKASASEAYVCRHCNARFLTLEQAIGSDCKHRLRQRDTPVRQREGESDRMYYFRLRAREFVPHAREDFYEVAKVTTEFGDFLPESAKPRPWGPRGRLTSVAAWMESDCSPYNRGVLPEEREYGFNRWLRKFKHQPGYVRSGYCYRQPKVMAERRSLEALKVEPDAPNVRGKRGASALPGEFDEKYVCLERTWKRKKVRKQWMVNA